MKNKKKRYFVLLFVLLVVIDQVIKILVKTNMSIGENFNVLGDWFKICFIENEGMAFGMKFGGSIGKFLLSSFRIILFIVLSWWIFSLIDKSQNKQGQKIYRPNGQPVIPTGVLIGLTLINAGALGNIIDCLIYGQIFSASNIGGSVATFGGSYAPLMFGKVVDMFYFPLIDTTYPNWIPFVGGQRFVFFEPVFNFADSCVSVGATYLLLFHYKFFMKEN